MNEQLDRWVRHAHAAGWVCVRARPDGGGHVALDEHAKSAARPTLEQCLAWVAEGGNVEVLLHESGLLQVDAERGAPAPWSDPAQHQGACLASSAGGGLHAVYARPGDVEARRWIRAVPGVDLLSRGVWPLPGCRRTGTEKKAAGSWTELAPPRLPGPPPDWVLAAIPRRAPSPPPRPTTARGARTRRAAAAMAQELAAVENAPDGRSHDVLVRAAGNLGQLVGSGELDEVEVRAALEEAARRRQPHQAREALKAIDDQVAWGKAHPRPRTAPPAPPRAPPVRVPEHEPGGSPDATEAVRPARQTTILVPGRWVMPTGEELEQSPHAFASITIGLLPLGALYRRGRLPGRLTGPPGSFAFEVLEPQRMRMLASQILRFAETSYDRAEKAHREVFVPLTRDHAAQVLARAADHPAVRELEWIASHPFCVGPDFEVARQGFTETRAGTTSSPAAGVFFDPPPGLRVPAVDDPAEIRAVLEDLVVDFPFAADGPDGASASRENFFGLLLTPIMRPSIDGCAPMHVATSPIERTGKTTLMRDILGATVLGQQTPALQLTGTADEQDKRVTAKLLAGANLALLDNLSDEVDSGVLAALLTAPVYEGRRLGVSEMVAVTNRMTVCATGNNVRASSEIAKRSVPIVLDARTEHPEERSDFVHERALQHAMAMRPRVLGALLGAIELWRRAGRPASRQPMGGFEAWRDAVGGVLSVVGYVAWLANRKGWSEGADDFSADLALLARAWWTTFGEEQVGARELLVQAEVLEIFGRHLGARDERARATAFGMRVLRRAAGRVVSVGDELLRVERRSSGSSSSYRLVKVPRSRKGPGHLSL